MEADKQHLREFSLAEHLGRCHRLWRMVADAELSPLGLTHPRWTALWKLGRMGNGVSQKLLADSLEIELPSLMRTLGHLEEQGLVERHCCDEDKRVRTVHITAAGQQILDQMESSIINIRQQLLDGVSAEQLNVFEEVLSTITRNAQNKLHK